MILKLLSELFKNMDNKEKHLMKGVLGLLMFHRKMTYQNKDLSQQHLKKGNKYSLDNYDDGGDHKPPNGSLQRPHKISMTSKRKRQKSREGGNEGAPKYEIVLEDMDLDVNIKDI